MFKSISYYNDIADNFLTESNRTFSKAIINESLHTKQKYSVGDIGDDLEFDIFLSHSYLDKKTVFGIYRDFENLGHKTYVDRIVDPSTDRDNISKHTAETLRKRMKQSKCLIYAISSNILTSKCMPWELGFIDGYKKGKVAAYPLLTDHEDDEDLLLPKYLELYFSCSKEKAENTQREILWINERATKYIDFMSWLTKDEQPYKRSK